MSKLKDYLKNWVLTDYEKKIINLQSSQDRSNRDSIILMNKLFQEATWTDNENIDEITIQLPTKYKTLAAELVKSRFSPNEPTINAYL